MSEYFDDGNTKKNQDFLLEGSKLPVVPTKAVWSREVNPERLEAKFLFKSADAYSFFLSEVAMLERRLGHHGILRCEYPSIEISISTHDLKRVTQLDVSYSKKVLDIYRDAKTLEIKN